MGTRRENIFADLNDKNDKTRIEDMLDEEEEILWRGKPKRDAYIANAVLKMLPIAIIWLCFDTFFIVMVTSIGGGMGGFGYLLIPFFIIHLAPVWIWISNIIKASTGHKNIEYAITDKKIIIRSGIIGIDFKMISFSEIAGVHCQVGFIDKMLHVGDIYIKSIGQSVVLYDLEKPYEMYNRIQKIVNDIKTDMNYPNDLRPMENHGYNTKYRG